jgi:hypothetical protein
VKKLAFVSAAVVAVLGSLLVTQPASASSTIQITKIYYNSPGSDSGSNTSLNAEYVVLKNKGTTTKNLYAWTVRDYQGHVYKFGTFYLKPGYSVTIHTGKGTNSSTSRYWGLSWYVWNNSGYDRAALKNASGTAMDYCAYTGTSTGYLYC